MAGVTLSMSSAASSRYSIRNSMMAPASCTTGSGGMPSATTAAPAALAVVLVDAMVVALVAVVPG